MISRRVFLKDGAFALVSLGFAPSFLARTAIAAGDPSRRRHLIAIFQRGAVDGLSVIVPFGEARVLSRAAEHRDRRARVPAMRPRSISMASSGSTPGFIRCSRCGTRGQLAIVHACGSPDSTRSHFDAQDYMETATPGVKSTPDGWLNRYLQATDARSTTTPFRAVALTPQLPRMLQGGPRARDQSDRAIRHPRGPAAETVRRIVRSRNTRRRPIAC